MLIKAKAPAPQGWQQQLAIARMWSAQRLGKISKKKAN